jgi:hypothetical protein
VATRWAGDGPADIVELTRRPPAVDLRRSRQRRRTPPHQAGAVDHPLFDARRPARSAADDSTGISTPRCTTGDPRSARVPSALLDHVRHGAWLRSAR